ncbi:hypothetical protein vBSauS24_41 [Staphylococcus phage vB_Sau_S24]|nr:hypothetical protein vBSauS24_41 [Staphylococcus phage vB_Sau_S24]
MAFNYTPLTETQKLKDMYPKVNAIGNFLKTEVNLSDIKSITGVDFNNILDKIPDSGNYYVTTSTNQPPGENWNGFVRLDKRSSNYYKIYYSPFNNNKMYIKTYANGTVYDWISFKLDEGSLYNEGNTLNVKELTESTTQYATLVNPPKENLNTGWVNYKESKNGVSSLVEFNPVNSTSTFKMMRKLPVQEQNPNLLKDSLFEETQYNLKPWGSRNSNWKWDTIDTSDTSITNDISFEGNKTAKITNNGTGKYPIIRSRELEIGKDVQPGEQLTFSTYLYVPSLEAMKDNAFYIQVDKYTDDLLDVNNSIQSSNYYKADLKEQEWQRLTVTVTVPPISEAKYIACAMRITTVNSGTGTDMTGYYALPKLERGSKATPFITHQDDKVQYDEIWSNWIENVDEQSILNNYTSDVNKDNYFKYAWFTDEVNGMSLKELIMTVPQGYHTFYCQGSINGTPKGRSIRGTIQLDYDNGDPNNTNKFINVQFTDSQGVNFILYYGGHNIGWKPLRQQRATTILWEGTLDYGSKDTIPLNDSWTNYDLLEVVYLTQSAGHYKTMFLDLRTPTTPYLYIRDFNLANNSTGSGVDFFEGYASFPTNTSATPAMSKKVTLNGSTNTSSVASYNEQGLITIYRIAGINTL